MIFGMNEQNLKQVVYTQLAGVLAAAADPLRLELIELVSQCPRNVETLVSLTGARLSTVSHHLQVLKRSRLVQDRREGRMVFYQATSMAAAIWDTVANAASRELAEIRCALDEWDLGTSTEITDYFDLVDRSAAGELVLLDVRPTEEFAAAHVPGAINIPLNDLARRVGELPSGSPVVAYCRGRYCVLSHQATRLLNDLGFSAARMPEGIMEWRAAGQELART